MLSRLLSLASIGLLVLLQCSLGKPLRAEIDEASSTIKVFIGDAK